MHIAYSAEQEQLREELRSYFSTLMTPERRAALTTGDSEYGDGVVYKEAGKSVESSALSKVVTRLRTKICPPGQFAFAPTLTLLPIRISAPPGCRLPALARQLVSTAVGVLPDLLRVWRSQDRRR